jgi:hypothetical protein
MNFLKISPDEILSFFANRGSFDRTCYQKNLDGFFLGGAPGVKWNAIAFSPQ